MIKTLILGLVCLAILGCSNPKIEEKIKQDNPIAKEEFEKYQILLLELHNKERKNKKIEELKIDKSLCEYAQKHAENMANKNSLYHSKMKDLMEKSKGGVVGENVAWGQKTEQDVVDSWMLSPMHRWNILGKSYTRAGFGIAKSKDGSIYWCVVFANKEV